MSIKEDLSEFLLSADKYKFDFELIDLIDKYKSSDKYPPLYRYSPADYNNIRMLETRKIYLSPIGKMNDAFEGICSCIKEDEYLEGRFDNIAYTKCFSENNDNLVMWGLYADCYAGMCVKYDVNKLIGTEHEHLLYHLYPVIYSDERIIDEKLKLTIDDYRRYFREIDSKDGFQHSYDFLFDILHMFLIKNSAWKSEDEWRIVVTSPQLKMSSDDFDDNELEKKTMASINAQTVLFDCIQEIYIGPRMEKHKRQHIKSIGNCLGVPAIEMQLSKNEYKLITKEEK